MNRFFLISFVCVAVLSHDAANADIFTFDDLIGFTSATGATSAGLVPADGADSGFSVGDLTFTPHAPSSFAMDGLPDFGARIAGEDVALSGDEEFNISSASVIHSIGFDFHEVENDPNLNGVFIDSQFEVTLFNGASTIDSFFFERPNDSLEFVGVWSTVGFDRVEIRETVGGDGNEFFGNFLTGNTAAVPEPTSLAVCPLAVGILLFRRRRRK